MAGKEVLSGGKLGEWVRPISGRTSHEISDQDRLYKNGLYKNGELAELLDIIQVETIGPRPSRYQTENYLIVEKPDWKFLGRATWEQIKDATDNVSTLWHNGNSSYHGENDKVPEDIANTFNDSLKLIRPDTLTLVVGHESVYVGGSKRTIRARFGYKSIRYNFVVTDPYIEDAYFAKDDGSYPIKNSRICISLAEIFNGHAIKLVAAIITKDRLAL